MTLAGNYLEYIDMRIYGPYVYYIYMIIYIRLYMYMLGDTSMNSWSGVRFFCEIMRFFSPGP